MDTVSACRGPSDVFEDLDPDIAACHDARQALTEAKISLIEERADSAIDSALDQLAAAKGHLGY
jgi:hypothetical protein